jgi:DNA-binding Lrp family transcriptional regulator
MTNLSKNDSARSILITSGNMLFIHAELRSMNALDRFSEFASRTSKISNPRIGIDPAGEDMACGEELTPLDLRIIRAMHNDARKSTVDIADELGVSARTVRSHLDRMIENGLIELSTEVDPTYSEDTSSILRMFLREGTDKKRFQAAILREHFPQVFYCQSFINIPDFAICATITRTPKDLKRLLEKIQNEEGLLSVESNIAITGRYFDTWRDRLVDACDKDGAMEIAAKLSKKK